MLAVLPDSWSSCQKENEDMLQLIAMSKPDLTWAWPSWAQAYFEIHYWDCSNFRPSPKISVSVDETEKGKKEQITGHNNDNKCTIQYIHYIQL